MATSLSAAPQPLSKTRAALCHLPELCQAPNLGSQLNEKSPLASGAHGGGLPHGLLTVDRETVRENRKDGIWNC